MTRDKSYKEEEPRIGERRGHWTYIGGGVFSALPAFSSEQYEKRKENLTKEIIAFINQQYMPKIREKLTENPILPEQIGLSETELEELVRNNIDRIMLKQFGGPLFREASPDK